MAGTADVYYWYAAHNGIPDCDWLFVKKSSYYGFSKQPSYKVIEKYDLRFKMIGNWDDLTNMYF